MKIPLPKLPYSQNALEPTISAKTMESHYSGHLRGYVDKLNRMPAIANGPKASLEEIILAAKNTEDRKSFYETLPPGATTNPVYETAAQIYNHTFFFRSMSPRSKKDPTGDIKDIINAQYGSWDNFKRKLIAKGKSLFGSGWIWVCLDDEADLVILKGFDAETPLVYRGLSPVLCIDVWEHAYYLDYKGDRGAYLTGVVSSLLNWEFANKNLANA